MFYTSGIFSLQAFFSTKNAKGGMPSTRGKFIEIFSLFTCIKLKKILINKENKMLTSGSL